MSSASKWRASNSAYNENKNYNTNKLAEDFGNLGAEGTQNLQNQLNDWYNNVYGGPSKYYFRNSNNNRTNEYNNFVDYQTNKDKNALQAYIDANFGDLGTGNSWLNNYYGSNYGQDSVNNLLDTQYNAALEQVERAKNRGLLSDTGYQSALNNLGTQYNSGYANLNSTNQSILDDYKNALTENVQNFASGIDNYNLNKRNAMNTDNFNTNLQNLYNQQQNNYQSDFDAATSGMNFFDTSDIINNARTEQGVNNAQTDELMDAIDETSRQKQKKAGLGNTGVF